MRCDPQIQTPTPTKKECISTHTNTHVQKDVLSIKSGYYTQFQMIFHYAHNLNVLDLKFLVQTMRRSSTHKNADTFLSQEYISSCISKSFFFNHKDKFIQVIVSAYSLQSIMSLFWKKVSILLASNLICPHWPNAHFMPRAKYISFPVRNSAPSKRIR